MKNNFFVRTVFVIGVTILTSSISYANCVEYCGAQDRNCTPCSVRTYDPSSAPVSDYRSSTTQTRTPSKKPAPASTATSSTEPTFPPAGPSAQQAPAAQTAAPQVAAPKAETVAATDAEINECQKYINASKNDYDANCAQKLTEATSNCNSDKDSGIDSAINGLSSMAVGAGVQSACTAIGKAVGAANAAVAAFTEVCSSARSSCLKACETLRQTMGTSGGNKCDKTRLKDAKDALYADVEKGSLTCKNLDAKIQQGVAAVNNTMGTIQSANSCAASVDTTLLYCKQNPTAIGCTTTASDCSNPSIAASSPICICNPASPSYNPNNASCGVQAAAATAAGTVDSGAGSAGLVGGAGTGVNSGLDNVDWAGREWKPTNGSAEDPGGNKGGRPIQEGGASSPGGPEGAAAAAAAAASVNSGFRGAGSGSGGGGFSAGEESGARGTASAAPGNPGGPDLRNFLPGGKFDPKARGIAGISGPDGITGPFSNIWQKIQNRYRAESPKLFP